MDQSVTSGIYLLQSVSSRGYIECNEHGGVVLSYEFKDKGHAAGKESLLWRISPVDSRDENVYTIQSVAKDSFLYGGKEQTLDIPHNSNFYCRETLNESNNGCWFHFHPIPDKEACYSITACLSRHHMDGRNHGMPDLLMTYRPFEKDVYLQWNIIRVPSSRKSARK